MMKLTSILHRKKRVTRPAAIKLDLSSSSRPMAVADAVFLGVAALASMAVVADYFNSRGQIASILQAATGAAAQSAPSPRIGADELNAAQKAMDQLVIPWNVLFSAMEKAASDKVRLISLEPDAEKRRMRIVAETEDVYEMLEYLRRLSAQPGLGKIVLGNQQAMEDGQKPAVRFTLEGSWALR